VEALIAQKVQVIIICRRTATAAAAAPRSQGRRVKVISYDRPDRETMPSTTM